MKKSLREKIKQKRKNRKKKCYHQSSGSTVGRSFIMSISRATTKTTYPFNHYKRWSKADKKKIDKSSENDQSLSNKIGRTVTAIIAQRWRINN